LDRLFIIAALSIEGSMPFYEYECPSCGKHHEVLQKITDKPLKKCPSCGKNGLKKLMSAPVFRLKGSGWYETDFKSDKENKRNLAGADKEEAHSKDKSEDKKPDDKAEAKADAKTEAKAESPKPERSDSATAKRAPAAVKPRAPVRKSKAKAVRTAKRPRR
jgi:putative FmdB family regulatory protein